MAAFVEYVYARVEERFACLVRVHGESFERIEIDFEDGSPVVALARAQLATPGTAVKAPGDARPLHVQLLRAAVRGTRGPLLLWLGQERLLAFLADAEPTNAVLAVMTDVAVFRQPDGKLDAEKVKADALEMTLLAARIQLGFAPGESE